MSEIDCGDCWRRANLTEDQLRDPDNAVTDTMPRCTKHQRVHEDLMREFGPYLRGRSPFDERRR